jgi:CRP/FNR family cyclic AMP-dependent transcriptional regulator
MFTLENNTLFEGLPSLTIDSANKIATWTEYKESQYVVRFGENSNSIFFINSGIFLVSRFISEERIINIAELKQNDFFGEMAVFDSGARSADVICSEDGVVAEILKSDFLDLFHNHREMPIKIIRILINNIRELNNRLEAFSSDTPENRILKEFLKHTSPSYVNPNFGTISPAPKHTEIAAWTGTSKEEVLQTLAKLIKNNIFQRKNNDYMILNMNEFQRMVRNG